MRYTVKLGTEVIATVDVDPDSDGIDPSVIVHGPDGTPLLGVDFHHGHIALGSWPYGDDDWAEFAAIGNDGRLQEGEWP